MYCDLDAPDSIGASLPPSTSVASVTSQGSKYSRTSTITQTTASLPGLIIDAVHGAAAAVHKGAQASAHVTDSAQPDGSSPNKDVSGGLLMPPPPPPHKRGDSDDLTDLPPLDFSVKQCTYFGCRVLLDPVQDDTSRLTSCQFLHTE